MPKRTRDDGMLTASESALSPRRKPVQKVSLAQTSLLDTVESQQETEQAVVSPSECNSEGTLAAATSGLHLDRAELNTAGATGLDVRQQTPASNTGVTDTERSDLPDFYQELFR